MIMWRDYMRINKELDEVKYIAENFDGVHCDISVLFLEDYHKMSRTFNRSLGKNIEVENRKTKLKENVQELGVKL